MDLNAAMLAQDSAKVNQLLHKKCNYGHSNGWIEKKNELIANMFNGTLKYTNISQGTMTAVIEDKTGLLRSNIEVDVIRNGQPAHFRLHVLQVWIWKNKKGWQLLGRQATRLPDEGQEGNK